MKKLFFMISFSLMILATLLLAGCGNQKAFAGQASGFTQSGGSGFQCSDGEDCGFVTDMWVVGKIRNALSDYVNQQGLSNALSGYATNVDINNRLSNLRLSCMVISSSAAGDDDFCRSAITWTPSFCVNSGVMTNTTYFDSTNGQCNGAAQLTLTSTKLVGCGERFINTGRITSCSTTPMGSSLAEPLAGDFKTHATAFITCCYPVSR